MCIILMADSITGTIGTAAINKDYTDAAYMDGDNEAAEVDG